MTVTKLMKAEAKLKDLNIDTWLILSREGSDPALPMLTGIRSVHQAAILIRSNGNHIVLTSQSDKGSYESTNLFKQVITYETSMEEPFLKLWKEIKCNRLAINISENDPFCDGLSQGLYKWLADIIGEATLKELIVSSEAIIKSLENSTISVEHRVQRETSTIESYEIQKEKQKQLISYLHNANLDLWLVVSSADRDPSLPLIAGINNLKNMGVFIYTKQGQNIAICSRDDLNSIQSSKLYEEVISCSSKSDLEKMLQKIITRFSPKKIAINFSKEEHLSDGLTAGNYQWIQKTLADVFDGSYVSSENFLPKLRAIKSDTEIEKIRKAIKLTEEIYDVVFRQLRVGMTEYEIGFIFVDEMKKRGVVNGIDRKLSMPIVMKENIAHRSPSHAAIQPGDLLIMDFSVELDGYVSDIARTVYFLKEGEDQPPIEIQTAFNTIYEAISLAGNMIKPGIKGFEVDEVARKHYLSKGYPEIGHATGHQIGREVHDGGCLLGPRWERYGNAPYQEIKEGNVFTIEPTIFLDNGIHFIVEENVVVTKNGINYLTNRQKELILITSH